MSIFYVIISFIGLIILLYIIIKTTNKLCKKEPKELDEIKLNNKDRPADYNTLDRSDNRIYINDTYKYMDTTQSTDL